MDRNTFTGIFLIILIIAGYTYFSAPNAQDLKREKHLQDSLKLVQARKAGIISLDTAKASVKKTSADSAIVAKGPFGAASTGDNKIVTLENEHIKVNISAKGGRIESVILKTVEDKQMQTFDKKPVVMFEGAGNKFGLKFLAGKDSISTNDLYFTASSPSATVTKNDSASVTMRLTYAEGKYIDYLYTLKGESYKVGFTIITKGMGDVISPSSKPLLLKWDAVLKQKEKDLSGERQRYSTAYYKVGDEDADFLNTSKAGGKELGGPDGKVQWISFKQHFFSNVLIAKNGFTKATVSVDTTLSPYTNIVKIYSATMQLPFTKQDVSSYPMEFYFGANKFDILKNQGGYGLERQVYMGAFPFKYINRFVVLPVFNFLESFNWGYGLIILALTILLKLVLSPLTYKSYLSMAKMRVLKPEIDEIKAKVGDDNPTLLQQESMKVYKKAGVNPLGGCIPMILQLPIVFAFFSFFPNLFELRGQRFLWMDDLSTYDSVFNFPSLPFIGNHLSLMCLLMTVSTLIYTYFNNQLSGATGQMKYIGYIMPIMFIFALNSYPSGLNYYYFLANMLTFAQQYAIRQMVDDGKILAQIQENKKKPAADKKSKFQQRMDDYMRSKQTAPKPDNQKSIGKKK